MSNLWCGRRSASAAERSLSRWRDTGWRPVNHRGKLLTRDEAKRIVAKAAMAAARFAAARRGVTRLRRHSARIGFVGKPLDNPATALGYPAFLDELKKSGFKRGPKPGYRSDRSIPGYPLVFAETADLVRSNMELLIVVGTEIRTLVANCRFRGAQDMARAA
jgi:hypothetical protein